MNNFDASPNGAQSAPRTQNGHNGRPTAPQNGYSTLSRAEFETVADRLGLTIPEGDNRRGPNPFTGKGTNGFVFFFPEGNGSDREGNFKASRREMLERAGFQSYATTTPTAKAPKHFDKRSLEERGLNTNARAHFQISGALGVNDSWGEYRQFPTFYPDGTQARSRRKFRDPSRQPIERHGKPRQQAKTLWDNEAKDKGQPIAYGLNWIASGEIVYLVNSELAVWLFWQEGKRAICPLGESRNDASFRAMLQAAKDKGAAQIVVMLDNDSAGQTGAAKATSAAQAVGLPATAKQWRADAKAGYDASDFWEECRASGRDFGAALHELSDAAPKMAPAPAVAPQVVSTPEKKSQADLLLQIALEETTSFRNDSDEFFATVARDGRRFTHRLNSQAFRSWLSLRHFEVTRHPANNSAAIQGTIETLRGLAMQQPAREVFTRIAATPTAIYYDLADETGRVVEITANGWKIVDVPPVPFVRPKGTLPQVEPQRGGNISLLSELINVTPGDFPLVIAFVVSFFQPQGPRPHLGQIAEQGAGKTSNTVTLRQLLDPNAAPTRKEPKDERDAMICAKNNAVVAFDNLSHLPQWRSDLFCCLSTGAGYATRANYTDDEEIIFSLKRPVIFNAITEVASRPDLLDRTLLIDLPLLSDKKRRPESEMEALFQHHCPLLLGALFDAVTIGLKNLPTTRPENLPRMADFALWIEACAPAFGWQPGQFLEIYTANRKNVADTTAELSTLAQVVERWFAGRDCEPFKDKPQVLFGILESVATLEEKKASGWPKDVARMGRELKRLAPILRGRGIEAHAALSGSKRLWEIKKSDGNSPNSDGSDGNFLSTVAEKSLTGQRETPNSDGSDGKTGVSSSLLESEEKEEKREEIEERRKEAGFTVATVATVATDSSDATTGPDFGSEREAF